MTENAATLSPQGKKPKGETDSNGSGLYAAYHKVHPKKVSGLFRTLKNWAAIILLGIYVIGPWLRWDRGPGTPNQAILLDMEANRGYIFGIEIWPQEIYYLTGVLILGAIGLFFATALLGRVWCGFTCIQTVFTDVFVMVERLLEGDRNQRIKLDRGPMTAGKFVRKTIKVAIWTVISLITGWTWVIYFSDAPTATMDLLRGDSTWGMMGFALLVAGFTLVLAGWAREQVCIYMCPWPRFQASMYDEDSLVVTYEAWRGEPRGYAKKDTAFTDRGHCVDCTLCVQACPTGIDIRDGSQLACIGCGLCIDACNTVMDRFGLPRNLIAYDSNNNMIARTKGEPTKYRFVRPRTIIYAVLLTVVVAVMAVGLGTRSRLEVNILHERSPLFVALSDGSIRNGYTFKILNMAASEENYVVSVEGIPGATLRVIGYAETDVPSVDLPVKKDTVGTFRIYVTAPTASLKSNSTDMSFKLVNKATQEVRLQGTLFAGPAK
ncbi:cytochrome c oxidase accessory protein CcoG [Insolitispirillum peregrinum]|uniref:Cytochrome c oxidase accessory protein FixG n=1 Tax=Insolitispirillum peregrinum TaxID=80876 RepID=A0A1N7PCP4_9PROT|nr:cytochrome c oxidase accessory protein CcoG [Insolitispirillum peregrinum]SIT08393.1 cytochrome c oxidase accessory protein FixG [Insolitispirillum peregrinum]